VQGTAEFCGRDALRGDGCEGGAGGEGADLPSGVWLFAGSPAGMAGACFVVGGGQRLWGGADDALDHGADAAEPEGGVVGGGGVFDQVEG